MSNTRESEQTTINTFTNNSFVQNMPLIIPMAIQQEQVHIQAQVQEYERKNEVNTRVIDETTLRMYFPGIPNTDSMISASAPERSTLSMLIRQDKATITTITQA